MLETIVMGILVIVAIRIITDEESSFFDFFLSMYIQIFSMFANVFAHASEFFLVASEELSGNEKRKNEDIEKKKNDAPVSLEGELGSIILELINNGYDIEVWKNCVRFKFPDGRITPNVMFDDESGYRNIVFLAYADYLQKKREKITEIVIQDFEKMKVDLHTMIDRLP